MREVADPCNTDIICAKNIGLQLMFLVYSVFIVFMLPTLGCGLKNIEPYSSSKLSNTYMFSSLVPWYM